MERRRRSGRRHCRHALRPERLERDQRHQDEDCRNAKESSTWSGNRGGLRPCGLIEASINTLKRDLIEEAIIVSLVIIVFLFHLRSALIPILTLPLAVLATFIPMYYLQVSSNIMSLGGLR